MCGCCAFRTRGGKKTREVSSGGDIFFNTMSLANEDDNSPYHFRGNKLLSSSRKKCPINSHWTKCYLGVGCASTCEKYLSKKPVPDCLVKCDSRNRGGCECNRGYYLNDAGHCVLPNHCPRTNKPKKQICQSNERSITKAKKYCNELTCEHYWDMEAVFTEPPVS
ncbi:hypothetical protein HCN44_005219 [Aphidius gifuensis]|uniref:TIL domain-containing protein n=1 Tax=Aphidius gifuensis TaxID=684658 RepID=A0A834XVI6_APHGI|nr:hypothetical protein HCN44_005219 [Aphidius gifuensis]